LAVCIDRYQDSIFIWGLLGMAGVDWNESGQATIAKGESPCLKMIA